MLFIRVTLYEELTDLFYGLIGLREGHKPQALENKAIRETNKIRDTAYTGTLLIIVHTTRSIQML
jgi:hypothetical protein